MNLTSKDISEDFPSSGKIYLNNASVSLMPLQSIEAMKDFLISYNSMGPDSTDSQQFVTEKLQNTRKVVAKIINCQPEEVILTQSTTDGINIVANGLSFEKNSNIIIRGLSHEHHANFYPWLRLQNKTKIKNLSIDKNGFFNFDEFKTLLDNNTKLVAISHALYNTGSILPVEKIGNILENNTSFFIDSAQTIGCIGNFDVTKTKCDFMSFNGSKWLCGPMGTGLFYCNKKSHELLEPITIGGESAMIYDNTNLAFKDIPDKFQTGFRNYVGMVGLESSANYLLKFGMENIREKDLYLSNLLREELSQIKNIILYGPETSEERTSIVSFNIAGYDPQIIIEKLEKRNIILAVREILEQKIIRASPHFFNTESEIFRVIDAIKNL
ncbi:MAG: aminotransferase class V-fold PLP-dependent enzyme [Nitrosarchaeum sp.]|nr:aminotransferase class V-fold PLP-dependent enzyme [Nitrosarchaeum sp.]